MLITGLNELCFPRAASENRSLLSQMMRTCTLPSSFPCCDFLLFLTRAVTWGIGLDIELRDEI